MSEAAARAARIVQDGRAKAYRPLAPDARVRALRAALEAYARGDFFAAHELLEPAWMGAADLAERAFHQGLIKLAAAYVHAVRGNPTGVVKNLRGARERLERARLAGPALGRELGLGAPVDLDGVVAAIDERLGRLEALGLAGRAGSDDLAGRAGLEDLAGRTGSDRPAGPARPSRRASAHDLLALVPPPVLEADGSPR